jgi:inward rectifier potassium channel
MRFREKKPSSPKRQRSIPFVHIRIRDGQFEIVGLGAWYSYWRDPYHLFLTVPWYGFLGLITLAYMLINTLFALAYLLGGDCIANAQPGSFLDAFFFSVQTLASIGYGAMYPKTFYANAIVTIEALTGLIGLAVMTGLSFARFSRPTARVLFSKVAVITPHDGIPTLAFRTANQRRNQILEAQLRVYLMRDEMTAEGNFIRRIRDIKLLRQQTPSFSLTWLAMHPIDEQSPLYGMTTESLIETKSMLVVTLSGIDETVSQTVHARHTYYARDILCNHRFVDVINRTDDGHRYIDYNYFHEVLPIEEFS